MEKFVNLKGVAAPFNFINIDTDKIIPKQFLKTIKRTGLGKNLFYEMRYDENGKENKDFIDEFQKVCGYNKNATDDLIRSMQFDPIYNRDSHIISRIKKLIEDVKAEN